MMKLVWLVLIILVLPVQAVQQYSESACLLLERQVADYQRRLGENSALATEAQVYIDTYCQHPTTTQSETQKAQSNKSEANKATQAASAKAADVPKSMGQQAKPHDQPVSHDQPVTRQAKTPAAETLLAHASQPSTSGQPSSTTKQPSTTGQPSATEQPSQSEQLAQLEQLNQLTQLEQLAQLAQLSLLDALTPFLPVAYTLISIILLGLAIFAIKKHQPIIQDRIGDQLVRRALAAQLDENQYTIIHDINLTPEDEQAAHVDHIVIAPSGIFVINTQHGKGRIFGGEQQDKWTQTIYGAQRSFQNPLIQNDNQIKMLAELLNIPTTQFESVVIFSQAVEMKTKMPNNVGHLVEMLSYIKAKRPEVFTDKAKTTAIAAINKLKTDPDSATHQKLIKFLNEKQQKSASC